MTSWLTVIEKQGRYSVCVCQCGAVKRVRNDHVKSGHTVSCGCKRLSNPGRPRNAGTAWIKHPIYQQWALMHRRCYNRHDRSFQNYGGKGIQVCLRWHEFRNFLDDMLQGYFDGARLGRKNNSNNFFLDNCHWVTPTVFNKTKPTGLQIVIDGRRIPRAEFIRQHVTRTLSAETIYRRLRNGMAPKDAVSLKRYGRL